ncbi:MAG: GNAT family N-acetyltransferase [Ilumatobacteraceae bacterium]
MSAEISLRQVNRTDEPLLLELYASTRDDVAQAPLTDEERREFIRMQFDAQRTDYEVRFPAAQHSIVLFDGAAGGRIWIDRRPDEIRLLDIALLPEHRDEGIGRVLVERLIDEARIAGIPLRHSVLSTNLDALRFYERLGFEVIEDFELYVLMEWRWTGQSSTRVNTAS